MTTEQQVKFLAGLLGGTTGKPTKFPNKQLCIAHAIKTAMLTPGDIVYVQEASCPNREAVFLRHTDSGKLTLYYYDDDKELGAMTVTPACITFEPVAEEEMPEPETVAGTIE